MSLDVLLTVPRLRQLAGYAFERGEAYWRTGRVLSLAVDDGRVDGVVAGTVRYRVRLAASGGELRTECSCPVGVNCKHAVAVGLAFLAQPAEPDDGERAGFPTRAALEAWAAAHQVAHALVIGADVLLPRLPTYALQYGGMRYLLGRLSLRDVGSLEDCQRHAAAVAPVIVEATHALLAALAADVAAGLAEEQARRDPPADEALRPLWQKVTALRRAARATAVPRGRAARAAATWAFDRDACALVWKERERIVRAGVAFGTHPIVAKLAFVGGTQPRLACTCSDGEPGCVHALALLDATLDVLDDPARAAEAREIAGELLRPGWSRALEAIARLEDKAAKPRPAIEVWWRIEHELRTLTLTPTVKKLTRHGTFSAGARTSVARLLDEYREVLSEQDLRVAEQLDAWDVDGRGTYPVRAFAALVGHPRITTESTDGAVPLVRVPLGFTALPAGEHIRLEPAIEGARFSPRLLAPLLATYDAGEPLFTVDPRGDRLLLIDVGDDARTLWGVLDKHGDVFPPESHVQLLDRLARLEAKLPLVVPRELKGRQLGAELVTVVRVRLVGEVALELEAFVRPGPGAPLFPPNTGPREVMVVRDGERGYVQRDLGEELARVRGMLARLPLDGAQEGPPGCFHVDGEAALALVAALQAPPDGLEAEWVTPRPHVASAVGPGALRVHVDKDRDWFGIVGALKVDGGRLELATVLDAVRRQQRFVRAGENVWVELTDLLRERLVAIADQTYRAKDRLELSPGAAPAIRALADAGATVATAPAWQLLTDRMLAAKRLAPRPPAALAATLRDYQVEGHAWLTRLAAWGSGACLADDMGLGKTVQAIAVLVDRAKLGPALVLAPTSVCFNWVDELRRFAPGLRPVLYAEQADRAGCLAKLRKKDVLIVSYGLLVNDAAALAQLQLATLVVDEAQALKNPATRRAKAARALAADFRIALSGTPLENHLGELWSLFAIVFPGLLGSWDQFRDRFVEPIASARRVAALATGQPPSTEAQAALSRVIRPFLLRRTKAEVARELPARTEIQVPIALSKEESALYEDARLAAVAELGKKGQGVTSEQRRFQVLAALTRLRLLASHPKLYDTSSQVASSKLRRLLELLEELRDEGHRALVFSQFTSHLALVREELDRAGFASLYLDGATPAKQRAALIKQFQDGHGDVFLISLKAGGTGINLTAADYVIHLDPWWNPAVEDQATDRAHRIGQTKPVTVYRLITRGTIEEKILALHADKRALVAGVLEGTAAAAKLGTRELLELLAGGDALADDDR